MAHQGPCKPKRMWMEIVKLDMKKCNLYEVLAYDRSEWRNEIHVADRSIVGTRLCDAGPRVRA